MPKKELKFCRTGKSAWRWSSYVCLLLIVAFSLSSCQTITRFSCNQKNWTKAGQKDGAAGKVAEETFLVHYEKCSAAGSEIDKSTYMTGYRSGLGNFCTLENGLEQATQGFENQNICQSVMGPDFDNGFAQGLAILCSSSGGQHFGLSGGIYRGSCPSDTEQAFLTSYLNAIDMALPQSIVDIATLEDRKDLLESQIDILETLVRYQDKNIKSDEAQENEWMRDQLKRERSGYENDLSDRRSEQLQTDVELREAKEKTENLQKMQLEWKLRLDV